MPSTLTPEQLAQLQALSPQTGNTYFMDGGTAYAPQVAYGQGQDGVGNNQTLGYMAYDPSHTGIGESYQAYGMKGEDQGMQKFQDPNSALKQGLALVAALGTAGMGGFLGGGSAFGGAAGGSGLAGDVLSKAALDGTTAFGANSVPGAFDLAGLGGGAAAAGGAGMGGGAAGGGMAPMSAAGGLQGTSAGMNGLAGSGAAFNSAVGGGGGLSSILGGAGGLSSLPGWLQAGAGLLGAAAGSQGVKKTETTSKDIPEWLKPYVSQNLNYASGLLNQQMQPGYLSGYDDMRSNGQGLLNGAYARFNARSR